MLITGIRSKPVYAPLQPDLGGRYHVMVGHGVGAAPLALREWLPRRTRTG